MGNVLFYLPYLETIQQKNQNYHVPHYGKKKMKTKINVKNTMSKAAVYHSM